jgi:hypothetical protein
MINIIWGLGILIIIAILVFSYIKNLNRTTSEKIPEETIKETDKVILEQYINNLTEDNELNEIKKNVLALDEKLNNIINNILNNYVKKTDVKEISTAVLNNDLDLELKKNISTQTDNEPVIENIQIEIENPTITDKEITETDSSVTEVKVKKVKKNKV